MGLSKFFNSVNHESLKVVVGIVGYFLHYYEDNAAYPNVRLVYTEVVAALSMLCSILWIAFSTAESCSIGPDLFVSLAWFAAFGSLMEYVDCHHCTASPFNIHYRTKIGNGLCKEWRATEAFAFITGVLFLGNAIIVIYTKSFSCERRPTTSSPGMVEGGGIATDVR
jgi:hypothetical protein